MAQFTSITTHTPVANGSLAATPTPRSAADDIGQLAARGVQALGAAAAVRRRGRARFDGVQARAVVITEGRALNCRLENSLRT